MFSPYGNVNESVISWEPEPQRRGTFTILSTCLLTLGLCVWTAVHLNVPQYKHVESQLGRKVGWLIMGMFAPEMVTYTAYHQYSQARKVNEFVTQRLGHMYRKDHKPSIIQRLGRLLRRCKKAERSEKQDAESDLNLRHPWTKRHGFYVVMGGFAIDSSDANPQFQPADQQRVTLTPAGLEIAAAIDPTMVPNLSKEEISDKSKANGLAKFIVCVQASWFCLQCVGRLARGLPISLLELSTFVHALCTLITYWLWWDKPLDVLEPTQLQGEHRHELMALLSVVQTRQKGFQIMHPRWNCRKSLAERGTAKLYWPSFDLPSTDNGVDEQQIREMAPDSFPLKIKVTNRLMGFTVGRNPVQLQRIPAYCGCDEQQHFIELSRVEVHRVELAAKGMRVLLGLLQRYAPDAYPDHEWLSDCAARLSTYRGGFVRPRIRNWPDVSAFKYLEFFNENGCPKPVTVGFSLAGLAYGLLHLSAWSALFPSEAQLLLWRISGLTVIASAPAILLVASVSEVCKACLGILCGVRVLEKALFALFLMLPVSYAALYVFSRVYLLVECFLTLSHLPVSAFQVPNWSLYLPHMS